VPLYVIEREFAEQLKLEEFGAQSLAAENLDAGMRWVFSFLSADRRKSYCLYEAPSAEVIRAAVRRAGLPDDVFREVDRVDRADIELRADRPTVTGSSSDTR
jgi:hypothetical protein